MKLFEKIPTEYNVDSNVTVTHRIEDETKTFIHDTISHAAFTAVVAGTVLLVAKRIITK